MHHGFYRTPLVLGCLKVLQQVFPSAAGAVQRHLSNESHGFGCASQHDWRAHADTQLLIDWKVRHGHLTSHCRSKFHTSYSTLSFDQLGGRRAASSVWSGHIRPAVSFHQSRQSAATATVHSRGDARRLNRLARVSPREPATQVFGSRMISSMHTVPTAFLLARAIADCITFALRRSCLFMFSRFFCNPISGAPFMLSP